MLNKAGSNIEPCVVPTRCFFHEVKLKSAIFSAKDFVSNPELVLKIEFQDYMFAV